MITLQEKSILATKKVVAKNQISLLKMFFATNSIVVGTIVAKGFSNDFGGCKRLPYFATSFIVAKDMSLQFLQCFVVTKKSRCQIFCIFSYNFYRC